MMAGNPNWWSMNDSMRQLSINNTGHEHHQFVYGSSNVITSSADSSASADNHSLCPDLPVRSFSQLLLGSLQGSEEEGGASLFQQQKKLENWEDQVLNLNPYHNSLTRRRPIVDDDDDDDDVKHVHQLIPQSSMSQLYDQNNDVLIHQNSASSAVGPCNNNTSSWPLQRRLIPVSSLTSCVTALNNDFLDLYGCKRVNKGQHQHNLDHSSEFNSTTNGGVSKKARVQQSSAQPAMKVRKEKLGDRITAIHQLVSPFGKTDTASVLSEAIGYIRFLHGQIEALSAPYIRNASSSASHHLHSHELLGSQSVMKGLRSRGLCLVPISLTQKVCNNDSGADFWAPAAFGGGF